MSQIPLGVSAYKQPDGLTGSSYAASVAKMKRRPCGRHEFWKQLPLVAAGEGAQRTAPPQRERGGQVREALPPSTNRGGKSQ
jgi:hypothetical protein